jgi:hypothetical protein
LPLLAIIVGSGRDKSAGSRFEQLCWPEGWRAGCPE